MGCGEVDIDCGGNSVLLAVVVDWIMTLIKRPLQKIVAPLAACEKWGLVGYWAPIN